jgi:hypothetical protein
VCSIAEVACYDLHNDGSDRNRSPSTGCSHALLIHSRTIATTTASLEALLCPVMFCFTTLGHHYCYDKAVQNTIAEQVTA